MTIEFADIQRFVGVDPDGLPGPKTNAAIAAKLGIPVPGKLPDRISEHFTLAEMMRSQTATRRGIDNTPTRAQFESLRLLATNVLEPVRAHFGKPVRITSGYRGPALNAAIGGAPSSQHCKGEAVDFEIPGVENRRVAKWIRDNLAFDQLILEGAKASDPNAGWIHCSFTKHRARKSVLTATFPGPKYTEGIA